MNKQEIVKATAAKAGMTHRETEKVLNAFLDTVTGALAKKNKVQLIGFGSFVTKARKARAGRNPQTGEVIKIAPTTVPVFKAGKGLRDAVAKKKAAKPAKKKK